jgi:hypothetical protein
VLVVESEGKTPWMLPWTVRAGEETWALHDIDVPLAVLALADPEGPCASRLDGAWYWTDRFWSDASFWQRFLGVELDRALSMEAYVRLPFYEAFARYFRVEAVRSGHINMQPESLFFEIEALGPSPLIDRARWHDPLVDGRPTLGWDVFLRTYVDASDALARQPWLLAWKSAGPDRSIRLQASGTQGHAAWMLEALVLPAWIHAGFDGEPAFELSLSRGRTRCATVFLARRDASALITTAKPTKAGEHELDRLELSFHPRGKPPTYARVGPDGRIEVRTIE